VPVKAQPRQGTRFSDWKPIFDHPETTIAKEPPAPQRPLRRDRVVPEKIKKPQSFATGQRHQVKVTIGRRWNLRG
jgi:hypothetical protein